MGRKKYDYDVIVIGGGAGGLTASKTARGFGKKVALIERLPRLGGDCTWTGCVPAKSLIKSAQVAWYTKNLPLFGLKASNEFSLITSGVMANVRSIVRMAYETHEPGALEHLGIEVLMGEPIFQDKHHIKFGDKIISAEKFIITTGSRPRIPDVEGIDTVDYLTSDTIFSINELPKSMIILGGGYIGVETAQSLQRLDVQTTIVQMDDRILPKEDPELVDMLTAILEKEGVEVLTSLYAKKVRQTEHGIKLFCIDGNGQEQVIHGETLFVATGRCPNSEGMGLENLGISFLKKGYIKVDDKLKTSAGNIYAAGDVVGPYRFAHMAWYQGVIAARNALIPFFKKKVNYKDVIWVTFSSPELARAGMLESEAREKYGDSIRVYRKSYAEVDRALTERAFEGMAKFICDKDDRLLGVHILGEHAGELIHETQLVKVLGVRFGDLQEVIHAYPTYSQLIWDMSKKVYVERLKRNKILMMLKNIFLPDCVCKK